MSSVHFLTCSWLGGEASAGHPDSVGLGRPGAAGPQAVGRGHRVGGGDDVGRETDGALPRLSPGTNISQGFCL